MNKYYEIICCYKYVLNIVVYFYFLFFNFSGLHGRLSFFDEWLCWMDDDEVDGPGRASDDVVGKDCGGGVVFVILARLAVEDLPFDFLLHRVVDSNDDSQRSP